MHKSSHSYTNINEVGKPQSLAHARARNVVCHSNAEVGKPQSLTLLLYGLAHIFVIVMQCGVRAWATMNTLGSTNVYLGVNIYIQESNYHALIILCILQLTKINSSCTHNHDSSISMFILSSLLLFGLLLGMSIIPRIETLHM